MPLVESIVQGLLLPCSILCQDDNEQEIFICQCHISIWVVAPKQNQTKIFYWSFGTLDIDLIKDIDLT